MQFLSSGTGFNLLSLQDLSEENHVSGLGNSSFRMFLKMLKGYSAGLLSRLGAESAKLFVATVAG